MDRRNASGSPDAGTALRRFGLCGNAADLARYRGDPRGALLQELQAVGGPPAVADPELLDTQEVLAVGLAKRQATRRRYAEQRARREAEARAGTEPAMAEDPPMGSRPSPPAGGGPRLIANGDVQRQELDHLLALAIATPRPLEERLALFWTNHFTVSAARAGVASMTGAFERDALRPHMKGRFTDLLLASSLHPAMLIYLDNTRSVGPNSPAGRGRGSVNENLAREIMELHALGVDGGYTQADVTEFAKALSGWTVRDPAPEEGWAGGAVFDPRRHEAGARTVLGKTYPDTGPEQARAVLRDLAAHPSTVRHVTRRLAQSFVGDGAPPSLAARLAEAWRASGGDLLAVTTALIRAPEAWDTPTVKLRSPVEFMMAASRVLGRPPPVSALMRDLRAMGQPIFNANSPKGWPLEDDAWTSPDGIKTRLDWSINVAARSPEGLDPRALAEQAFGPSLSDETRTAIARAESVRQGVAILLMCPEMQRR